MLREDWAEEASAESSLSPEALTESEDWLPASVKKVHKCDSGPSADAGNAQREGGIPPVVGMEEIPNFYVFHG